jgi:hypothetical protein
LTLARSIVKATQVDSKKRIRTIKAITAPKSWHLLPSSQDSVRASQVV